MAGGDQPFSHRSSLKQSNKPFKSRHATKGALKAKNKGTSREGKAEHAKSVKSRSIASHKADRRNAARIEQRKKRLDAQSNARLFQGLHATPKIVAVVPLCPDVSAHATTRALFASIEHEYTESNGTALMTQVPRRELPFSVERFKQRIQFVPTGRHLLQILEAVRVADMVLFVLSANEQVDKFGEATMSAIKSQGVPTVVTAVQHLETNPAKKHGAIRESLHYYMHHHFAVEQRVFSTHDTNECVAVLRHITSQRPKNIVWRDRHPYLLVDRLAFSPNADGEGTLGTLSVTGFVRGNKLDVNRLVHIPNYGDFQMSQILAEPVKRRANDMADEPQVLGVADPELQEPLVAQNEPDPMEGEQTWPTEEELAEADERVRRLRQQGDDGMDADSPSLFAGKDGKKRRVPKGTSSYQAAWILDNDDADEEDEGEDDDDDEEMDEDDETTKMHDFKHQDEDVEDSQDDGDDKEEEEYDVVDLEDRNMKFDALDADEEREQLEEYLRRQKESRDDLEFPDEVDTPQHIPARERFQRYRGLKSFRNSAWDPYENLPVDYSRIFQFQNFRRTRKRVMDSVEDGPGVAAGTYVTVHIKDVPREAFDNHDPSRMMAIFGLLPHEHKMSTVNITMRRTAEYTDPIKSKDAVVLMCGFRRYVVRPVYSTYTRGGPNNVHKFERFLQHGPPSVATMYAPIQFGPAPVLVFKHDAAGEHTWTPENTLPLIATGNLMDLDPLRIIAKRIILTGHPFKVHKRGAVIRYMFFNPEDVMYFKPVQLVTKLGRTGHIKESLGTHGYMKCLFDAGIKAHDTVCMHLYKRVFPKWNTAPFADFSAVPPPLDVAAPGDDDAMVE
ncbi:ribosome biogenesis protein tsr1 [Polyrhizophydium stewartii]|uniref:Ribosome biogenesis protein tsr1 n=1 Tax=Polyrhizophydium stewartii TaxID=2732419 RepID=A0ABR4NIK5_9FUNG|nr:hypothetical protein HK105_004749 [Polyrhizophydium stewartii]